VKLVTQHEMSDLVIVDGRARASSPVLSPAAPPLRLATQCPRHGGSDLQPLRPRFPAAPSGAPATSAVACFVIQHTRRSSDLHFPSPATTSPSSCPCPGRSQRRTYLGAEVRPTLKAPSGHRRPTATTPQAHLPELQQPRPATRFLPRHKRMCVEGSAASASSVSAFTSFADIPTLRRTGRRPLSICTTSPPNSRTRQGRH
jgi:hypothetical protein